MNVLGQAIRRSDVFDRARIQKAEDRRLHRKKSTASGVDSQGRFIGPGDVDRGFRFFLLNRNQYSN